MTKDNLIQMADLAGYDVDDDDDVYAPAEGRYGLDPRLEHFAELVAKYVLRYECRDVSTKSQNVDTSEKCVQETDKSIHDAVQKAIAIEQEACAKLCEKAAYWDNNSCAAAIRARGNK